jgi:hypothetical protein
VPRRNRVTPFGEIVAVTGRGTLMGNRGILHEPDGTIVRDSQVKRWIACRLEFRGRHREVMRPGTWTELFFLDEATAFSAGHRPCAECRNADYKTFQRFWGAAVDPDTAADAMDARLHTERRARAWVKRTYTASTETLPDGSLVEIDGTAWLVRGDQLLEWTSDGYRSHRNRSGVGRVTVLTPPSLVAVLQAGYPVRVHESGTD